MNTRTKVAVIYGGRSPEHQISCVSAGSIIAHLDPGRYEVFPIGITRDGAWVRGEEDPSALAIIDGVLPSVTGTRRVALSVDPTRPGVVYSLDGGDAGSEIAVVDVVLPVLHGPNGEDGTVQGLLELSGIPYAGPGVLASAVGMDKEATKIVLGAAGIPIGRQVVLRDGETDLTEEQRGFLGLPVFVKPARGGSSIGISRVADWARLGTAIAEARRHDPKVIVEAGIVGHEVECGVLEFPDGTVRASEIARLHVPGAGNDDGDGFYDFDTKYLDDVVTVELPAALPREVGDEVRALAVRAFEALGGKGLARVDFFVTEDGPILNEVNTMPGFTPISMYPQMWEVSGIDYPRLLDTLVGTALAGR